MISRIGFAQTPPTQAVRSGPGEARSPVARTVKVQVTFFPVTNLDLPFLPPPSPLLILRVRAPEVDGCDHYSSNDIEAPSSPYHSS